MHISLFTIHYNICNINIFWSIGKEVIVKRFLVNFIINLSHLHVLINASKYQWFTLWFNLTLNLLFIIIFPVFEVIYFVICLSCYFWHFIFYFLRKELWFNHNFCLWVYGFLDCAWSTTQCNYCHGTCVIKNDLDS